MSKKITSRGLYWSRYGICCLECNENSEKKVNKNSELENGPENGFYMISLGPKPLEMDQPSVAKLVVYSGPGFGLKNESFELKKVKKVGKMVADLTNPKLGKMEFSLYLS